MRDTPAADRIKFLRGLRVIRRFRPDPVPQEVVDDVLEVARWTGSSANRQPWELILVRDRERMDALSRIGDSPGLVPLADAALVLVPVLTRENAELDAGRLLERIMLAAAAHGVGASVAGFGSAIPEAKELLRVPDRHGLRVAVALGYPADERARLVSVERDVDTRLPLGNLPVGRKPLSRLVHFERYGSGPATEPGPTVS
ncbi:MAG TPA: nitroreductase family protein [Actinophytocola sp.]|jgi:nitroreductase|uniref:nitroreductase family protein n=1 Tax=Actinophytocola sp. TaxID=1872138 RepID=UPI002F921EC6